MKTIAYKQTNKIGGEYMNDEYAEVEVWKDDDKILLRTGEGLYFLPIEIFKGLL